MVGAALIGTRIPPSLHCRTTERLNEKFENRSLKTPNPSTPSMRESVIDGDDALTLIPWYADSLTQRFDNGTPKAPVLKKMLAWFDPPPAYSIFT